MWEGGVCEECSVPVWGEGWEVVCVMYSEVPLLYSKFMRTECLNSRFVFDTPLPISRLVEAVGDSIQILVPLVLSLHFTSVNYTL